MRLLHIGAGVFWAGGAMLMGWFVAPAARRPGPAAGPFMQNLLRARVADYMFGSAVVTVAAGIWLLFATGGVRSGWRGWALNLGALAGIIAIIIGGSVQRPTGGKLQRLGAAVMATGTPTPEQAAELGQLQSRLARAASTTALLVAAAVVGMALGG
ncbi:MAG: hypothetical protein WD651_14700 [Acidimicrobiia bacterium]